MLNKLTSSALALTLVAGLATATASDAEAGRRGVGVGAAIVGTVIGLGIAGAYAAERDRGYYRSSCYPGPRRCEVVGQRCWRDDYGYRQCRDDVRCWRPEICD